MMSDSLPILYFHRVNRVDPPHLAITPENFEKLLIFLKQNSYTPLKPDEIISYFEDKRRFLNPVVLTFDDGYYDNYLYAHPLLKKYQIPAIVFLVTRYIREHRKELPSEILPFTKANIQACQNPEKAEQFLTWDEIIQMEKSETLFSFSHSHSHRQVFISDEYATIYQPENPHWGIHSLEDFAFPGGAFLSLPRKSGLAYRAFIPDQDTFDSQNERFQSEMNLLSKGGDGQKKSDWKQKIIAQDGFSRAIGSFESEENYCERVKMDLQLSKEMIENRLQKSCEHLCWPWGHFSETSVKIAKKVGFKAIYTTATGANSRTKSLTALNRFQVKKYSEIRLKMALWLRKHRRLANFYSKIKQFRLR